MSDAITLAFKFIGSNRPAENRSIEPGANVADVLKSLGLGAAGFHITDPNDPDAVFNPTDNLFARCEDGQLLAVTAAVDAGREAAA